MLPIVSMELAPLAKRGPLASPAFLLLRACVARAPQEQLESALLQALRAGINVFAFAEAHRLSSLCYMRLQEAGLLALLPSYQAQQLRQIHLAYVDFQSELLAAAAEILALLQQAGLTPVLPIKGLAYVAHCWPEYLPRFLSDVDVLMPAASVEPALNLLEEAGFLPLPGSRPRIPWDAHAPERRRGRILIELHWTLPLPEAFQPFSLPKLQDLASRALCKEIFAVPFILPSREDCVLIQAAYLARDGFLFHALGSWAGLFLQLTEPCLQPQPEKLARLAVELGLEPLLAIVLRFLQELFGLPLGWESYASTASEQAYKRLRPILLRRLNPRVQEQRSPLRHFLPSNWPYLSRADARRLLPEGSALRDESVRRQGIFANFAKASGGMMKAMTLLTRALIHAGCHPGVWRTLYEDRLIARHLGSLAALRSCSAKSNSFPLR